MNTYALRYKPSGLYRHSSYKLFSADLDQAKVFATIPGAKLCMGWAIWFNETRTQVNTTKLNKIPAHIKQNYEIVEFEAKEINTIQL